MRVGEEVDVRRLYDGGGRQKSRLLPATFSSHDLAEVIVAGGAERESQELEDRC
jgi:hypothetical protein